VLKVNACSRYKSQDNRPTTAAAGDCFIPKQLIGNLRSFVLVFDRRKSSVDIRGNGLPSKYIQNGVENLE
jgi:hypothetical protein